MVSVKNSAAPGGVVDETFELLEAFSALRRELGLILASELKILGLGYNQMLTIYFLCKSALPMNELSALSYSDPASTSRTVAALEKIGLVKKASDPADFRRSIVELTKKGETIASEVQRTRRKLGKRFGASLSQEEKKNCLFLLKKIKVELTELQGTKL